MSSCKSLVGNSPIATDGSHATISLAKAVAGVTLKVENDGKTSGATSNSTNGVTGSGKSGGGGGGGASRRGDHRSRISRRVTRSRYPRPKPSTPQRLERIKQAAAALEKVKSKDFPTGAFQNDTEGLHADGHAIFSNMGPGGAKTGQGAGAAPVVPKTEVIVDAMDVEGRGMSQGPGLSGGVKRRWGSEWGLGELDEVVLQWYVLGLRKQQYSLPQAQWLLDLHAAAL